MFLRTGFVPQAVAESIHDLASVTYTLLDERGQRHEDIADLVPGRTDAPQTFNLASAVYHTSGAVPATFECPHGTRDGYNVSLEDILEIQLTLYEAVLAYAFGRKADETAG